MRNSPYDQLPSVIRDQNLEVDKDEKPRNTKYNLQLIRKSTVYCGVVNSINRRNPGLVNRRLVNARLSILDYKLSCPFFFL